MAHDAGDTGNNNRGTALTHSRINHKLMYGRVTFCAAQAHENVHCPLYVRAAPAIYCRAAHSRGVLEQMIRNRTHTLVGQILIFHFCLRPSLVESFSARREEKSSPIGRPPLLNALSPQTRRPSRENSFVVMLRVRIDALTPCFAIRVLQWWRQ